MKDCQHKKLSDIRGGIAGSGDGFGNAKCEECEQLFTFRFKFAQPPENIGSLDNLKKYLKRNPPWIDVVGLYNYRAFRITSGKVVKVTRIKLNT